MTDTSSANPAKLSQFVSDSTTLSSTLLAKANALLTAAEELVAQGETVPGLADFVDDLEDLALDWLHLDTFTGGVAYEFYMAAAGISYIGPYDRVIQVSDSTIVAGGNVGYADRDEAIAAAEAIAARLQTVIDDESTSVDDIADILADARRGMHDPAFAVTLSETLGVEGYVDVVGAIHEAHLDESGSDGIDAALADVAILGTIVTTALTRADPNVDDDDRPHDQLLDQAFVDDLTHDYDPGNIHDGPEHLDLSVLVSFTDPPTDIAVEIANHRISPFLDAARSADVSDQAGLRWGDEHSGVVTNYTEMLARNADASAEWLDDNPRGVGGGTNINLVLQQNGDSFTDGGQALADVVENGVTHTDFNTRRAIMRQAIEIVGAEGNILAIDHMPEALAKGVAADMALIDQQINIGWSDLALDNSVAPENAVLTHEFFRELMNDETAAGQVYGALDTYTSDQIAGLPDPGDDLTPGDGVDARTEALRRLGAVQGTIVVAEGNAYQDAAEDYLEAQGRRASAVNGLVGFAPYGALNDIADTGGDSVGAIAYPGGFEELNDAEQIETDGDIRVTRANIVWLALAEHPDRTPTIPVDQMPEREQQEFLEWARDVVGISNEELLHLTAAESNARDQFRAG